VERAVKAGYLESYARDQVCDALGEAEETPMEAVSVLAFAESMYGEQAPKHLEEAYLLSEAWDAAERWLGKKV